MKALNVLVVACLCLALLRYAVIALAIAACIVMLWALIQCPRSVLGLLLLGLATDMLQYHPYITLGLIAVAVIVAGKGTE
jgi:hypothetical protein